MAEAYYEPTPATDGATMNPVPGAVFEVFEIADTSFSTPLSLRVGSGNPTTTVTASDTLATLPGVYVTSPNYEHIWKSGTFQWRRDSIDGAKKAIEDAKIAANNAASASDASAVSAANSAQAAQDAAALVDAPVDQIMADTAANPATAFATQLSATIAEATAPKLDADIAASTYARPHSRTIALLGDSFTEMSVAANGLNTYRSGRGFFTHALQRLNQRLTLVSRPGTLTGGITGQTTTQILSRVQADVIDIAPGYCHVLAGTNDVGSSFTFATMTGNLTAIYDAIQNAGIRLIVGTIAPRSGATTAQLQMAENLNNWIRLQAVTRPGVILADYHRDLVGPTGDWRVTGTTAYTADGIHASTGGAMRMGKVLADALDPVVPKGSLLPASNIDALGGVNAIATPNLVTNPMMTGTAGALGTSGATGPVADGYTVTTYAGGGVTTGMTFSKVARADGPAGDWQQVVSTSSTAKLRFQQSLSTNANLAAGDELYAMVEYEVENLTAMNMFRLQIATFDAANGYANQGTVIDFDLGADDIATYPYALHPAKGVLRTPRLVYPATATGLSLTFDLSFVGTVRFGRFTLRRKRP